MFRCTLLMFSFFLVMNAVAQNKFFKKYKDTTHHFSFDIPLKWSVIHSKEHEGIICVPTTKAEKEDYKNCYEGIIFRVDIFNYGLDSFLNESYTFSGDMIFTTDRFSDSVPVKKLQGDTWVGLYHLNICGVFCNDNGFHAAGGECEFVIFSNGKSTIQLQTNGLALDDNILNRIISSFRFTK